MSYPTTHRPLIDLIPNNDSLYVSDEEDSFYGREDDYLIHPKWKDVLQRTSNRIPRRVQRYLGIYLALATIAWTGWQLLVGPIYNENRQEIAAMDDISQPHFGSNLRPEFTGMIQLKTLDEKYLPVDNKRLVVVGDVHGCREELEALLQKVAFDMDNDHLILTGDITNKGPDSPGVVSLARKLGASSVRGNHEDKLLLTIADMETLHTPLPDQDETANLQEDTLDKDVSSQDHKLRKLAKKFSKKEIAWLKQCPVILRVGQVPNMGEVVVVHAGLMPDIPLAQQDPYQVMNMRTIDLKTRVPSETREGTPWEKFWNHRQKKLPANERMTVIYGHDRKRGMNIEKYSKGIDSGCVGGGHLTALVIDSRGHNKYVQVKCKGYVD